MASPRRYNPSHTGVRRIMQEARELAALAEEPDAEFCAAPVDDDDLFEWHFTMRGPPDSPYAGGLYHGRIMLPANYPFKPPDVMLLTPSGRFETGRKICVSVTSFHPEQWQPSWGVRLLLTALRAFMITEAKGAIGGIDDCSDSRRAQMAIESRSWSCPSCNKSNSEILTPDPVPVSSKEEITTPADTELRQRAAAAAAAAGAPDPAPAPDAGRPDDVVDGEPRPAARIAPAPAPAAARAPVPVAVAVPAAAAAMRETPTIDAIMSVLFAAIVVLLVRKLFTPDAVL
jgi:ubiquitin-conjugating enzyme E2 J1